MSEGTVAAVLPWTVRGLARQTRQPDAVIVGADGIRRARASGAQWIWLLAPGADPAPHALECLLAARTPEGAPPPLIVDGAVVRDGGGIVEDSLPGWRIEDSSAVALAARHLLPIRSSTLANTLVDAGCVTRAGVPDLDLSRDRTCTAIRWTAQVLSDDPGYFVPASVVTMPPGGQRLPPGAALRRAGTLMRARAWRRGEAVAFLRGSLGPGSTSGLR